MEDTTATADEKEVETMFGRCVIKAVVLGGLLAFGGVAFGAEAQANWKPISMKTHPRVKSELFSAAVTIRISHEHTDGPPTVKGSVGSFINRHIRPGRSIKEYDPITRDSPGQDEDPEGTSLPLALFPRIKGLPWGGELLTDEEKTGARSKDTRTLHQRQWDYIQEHVDKCLSHLPATATLLEKVVAVDNYAEQWMGRERESKVPHPPYHDGGWISMHPVDVTHHGMHCAGVSALKTAMYTVMGLKSRNLVWGGHRSTEVLLDGKWVFCEFPGKWPSWKCEGSCGEGWAQITAEPHRYDPLTRASHASGFSGRAVHYALGSGMYWHNVGGVEAWVQALKESVPDGATRYDWLAERPGAALVGYMEYLPETATALYPTLKKHLFHVTEADAHPPTLLLCRRIKVGRHYERGIEPGGAVRKRFYLSDCRDNPITRGEAKWEFKSGPPSASSAVCYLDGKKLNHGKEEKADGKFAGSYLAYELPVERLTPGEHELVLHNVGKEAFEVSLNPDYTRPYHNPVSEKFAAKQEEETDL